MSVPEPGNLNSEANWHYIKEQLSQTKNKITSDIIEFLSFAGSNKTNTTDLQHMQQDCCMLAYKYANAALQQYIVSDQQHFPEFCIKLFDFAYQVFELFDNGMEEQTLLINDKTQASFDAFFATAKSRLYLGINKITFLKQELLRHEAMSVKFALEICFPVFDRLQLLLKTNAMQTGLIPATPIDKAAQHQILEDLIFYNQHIRPNHHLAVWSSDADKVFDLKTSQDKLAMIELLKLQAKCCMILGIAEPIKYLNAALYLCDADEDLLRAELLNEIANIAIFCATINLQVIIANKSLRKNIDEKINDLIAIGENLLTHKYGKMAEAAYKSGVLIIDDKSLNSKLLLKACGSYIKLAKDKSICAHSYASKAKDTDPQQSELYCSMANKSLSTTTTRSGNLTVIIEGSSDEEKEEESLPNNRYRAPSKLLRPV